MIEFFFDCSSPWTYIAFRNIQPLASELQETINWKPVLVGGIFNSVNKGIYAAREDMPPVTYATFFAIAISLIDFVNCL